MNFIDFFVGHGRDLNSLQMGIRAAAAFFLTLLFLRIAGIRTFGRRTAMDMVIVIMLGSVLSRIVVGASPMIPTLVACLVFVLVHRLLAILSCGNDFVGMLVKGEKISLYKKGVKNEEHLRKAMISKKDLQEGIRLKANQEGFEGIDEIFLERTGEISIIKSESKRTG
jgi:uncharacterized membrane protein YcaP (DUF421 family)